jgi:Xaa-Pro aminopeptidase
MTRLFVFILTVLTSVIVYGQNDDTSIIIDKNNEQPFYDKDLLPADFFAKRRQALRDSMPPNSVAIIFSNPIRNRSNDVDYEYHQNPDFYYLTGFTEPNAVLIIFKDEHTFDNFSTNEIIFVPEREPSEEVWTGKRLGTKGVEKYLKIKKALPNTKFRDFDILFKKFDVVLPEKLPEGLVNDKKNPGDLYSMVQSLNMKLEKAKNTDMFKLDYYLASMRQVKEPEEIEMLKKAIDITCDAQITLMKHLKPGMTEYQTEAIIEYVFKHNGAEYPGFPSIQGGGENSCILHYTSNRKPLYSNDLLVSDIGAEYHGYTADVTRTLPVDGKFSPEEKAIYNIVLEAQQAGINACLSGNKFWDPHQAAQTVIAKRLLELGIIKNTYEVNKYFIHGTSHYLGLDVHDAGLYNSLQPGNVITVEPGVYIPEGSDCDPKWWNIGVRIEDDILITKDKPVVLSAKAPRTVEEIEKLMQQQNQQPVIEEINKP